MKLQTLNCPSCGAPVEGDISPNQPFVCNACHSTIVSTDWTTSGELICSSCGKVNSSKNKYCDGCNTVLQAGCPYCYTQNSINTKYCKQCGVDLRKAWKLQRVWSLDRDRHEVDRQQKLKKMKMDSQAELQRLLLQLNDPASHPMAIPWIMTYGLDAVQGLIHLLDSSSDPDARYGAARALGDMKDLSAVPVLIKALNDEHVAVRFFAVDALGKLGVREAIPDIGKLLEDESPNVRKHAGDVLMQIGTPEALQILRGKSRPKWWSFGVP